MIATNISGTCSSPPRFATKKDARGCVLSLPDGSSAEIRLIRPSDRDGLVAFHRSLSDRTVYLRYFSPVSFERRTDDAHIADELCNDPDHHMTLIVERIDPISGAPAVVGVARLVRQDRDHSAAEFAMAIRDDFQGMGLGAALMEVVIDRGRGENLAKVTACVLGDNFKMLQLCREHGFRVVSHDPGGPMEMALHLH